MPDLGLASSPDRLHLISREFEVRFSRPLRLLVRAPGRVDLMGSHTDYNQGFVLTMSIDRDTWIAARPRSDRLVKVFSLDAPNGATFNLDHIEPDGESPWSNYVRGVARIFGEEGYPLLGFDGLIHTTLPLASGVSSSAALEVATAEVFKSLGGWDIDPLRLAVLCQRAENEFVGMQCGILDQYSSVFGREGHTLLLDCRDLTSRDRHLAEGISVVIGDTRVGRQLTASGYAERKAECVSAATLLAEAYPDVRSLRDVTLDQLNSQPDLLPGRIALRARFIVEENRRVSVMAGALEAADRGAIRRAMQESYVGARDLFEIVSPEMSRMVEAMIASPGVIGARQAGAGFGGCMVAVVEAEHVEPFVEQTARRYSTSTGLEPMVYAVQPAKGAGPLEV
jgi:galactokinase